MLKVTAEMTGRVDQSYYDRFRELNKNYLPQSGEGETMAEQACVAINKLVYKWYNDGDVFDNVHSGMMGWANDLSSYANWLYSYFDCDELRDVYDCTCDGEYETLLKNTADWVYGRLDEFWNTSKKGSVYECEGPFEFDIGDED